MKKPETFEEFDVVVRVRGVKLTQKKARDLIDSIISREMDHYADDWGSENKMSFATVKRHTLSQVSAPKPSDFFPGDDSYGPCHD